LNSKEQKRVLVLGQMDRGLVTGDQAAMLLGCSVRQVRRLHKTYKAEGAAGMVHGNRGRQPANTVEAAIVARVVALAQTEDYARCNHQHFTELLAEREAIGLSRSTVRRCLLAAGLGSPRRRKAPQHRSRRERMAQEGMLLQWDGSRHDWLEGRGPWLTLIGAIDDATGKVVAARFGRQEDGQGYLAVLKDILTTQGVPLAIYRDRHGIFERREREPWTIEEELAGVRQATQVGRCLAELGINSIAAHSPQAKGRIERLWGTLQDRLVIALRLAKASTLEEANRVLARYLVEEAQRFAVPAAQEGSAYRPLPAGLSPEAVCCFKYLRTVAKDNTVTLGEHGLQVEPTAHRASFAKVQVEVQERLDGSLVVVYQGHTLATRPAPATAPQLRARKVRRSPGLTATAGAAAEGLGDAAVAAGVDTWKSPALPDAPEGVHVSTPDPSPAPPAKARKPAATHPWFSGQQYRHRTESLNN